MSDVEAKQISLGAAKRNPFRPPLDPETQLLHDLYTTVKKAMMESIRLAHVDLCPTGSSSKTAILPVKRVG